jgi:hypothetical protein
MPMNKMDGGFRRAHIHYIECHNPHLSTHPAAPLEYTFMKCQSTKY